MLVFFSFVIPSSLSQSYNEVFCLNVYFQGKNVQTMFVKPGVVLCRCKPAEIGDQSAPPPLPTPVPSPPSPHTHTHIDTLQKLQSIKDMLSRMDEEFQRLRQMVNDVETSLCK